MATYKLEVIRRGTIIVDDVEDLEQAEEYVEGCNPVDDVEWSDYLQVTGGTKLKIIQIPYDFIQVKKIAEILDEPVWQIISKLFLNRRVVEENTCISFETAKELAEKYDVLLKKGV